MLMNGRGVFGEKIYLPQIIEYPYDANDGRENLDAGGNVPRVLRGGAFFNTTGDVRCAYRHWGSLTTRVSGSGVPIAPKGCL